MQITDLEHPCIDFRNIKCVMHKYNEKMSTNTAIIHKLLVIQCPTSAVRGHRKHLYRQEKMAEFGFFILGAVIGVPAALGGLGAYVRAKVCKCDG